MGGSHLKGIAMKKRTKARDILETICCWGIIIAFGLLLILALLVRFLTVIDSSMESLVLRLMAVAAVIFATCIFINIKIYEKQEKEYRDEYIIEMVIEDKTFGEIKFEKDILEKENELTCKSFKIPFGRYNPRIKIHNIVGMNFHKG